MHKIEQNTGNKLTIHSFPLAMFCLPVALIIFLLVFSFTTTEDLKIQDLLIFYGVCGVFLVIHKYRKTVIDKNNDLCILTEIGILGEKTERIKCSEIENFEMSYGRGGGAARGGTLMLRTKDNSFQIIDSDIAPKNEKKVKEAMKEIQEYLK